MWYTLRPYQLDVIERIRNQLRKGKRRIILQAPTGAGKTVTSSEIIRCAVEKGKRCLFLAHRRRLIDQKSRKLQEFGVNHAIFMNGHARDLSNPVQVASRDTMLSRIVRNEWVQPPPADLVIVDEAHRSPSDEYQKLLGMYRNAVVIGLTATPQRDDGKSLSDYYEAIECTTPASQLIREGYIVPLRCYAPVEMHRMRQGKKKKRGNKSNALPMSRKGLHGNPVTHWKEYGENRPTILFAGRVNQSMDVVNAFLQAGIKAEHMDAHTSDEERDAIVERLEAGETKILSNVGIATEGVDIPCLSCCILLRMARSYVLFSQAIGRIMRSHPGKKDGIILDHSGAIFEHGFPDDDVEWTLDDSMGTVEERNKKARKEGKKKDPIFCPHCGMLFRGSLQCPSCGKKVIVREKPQEDPRQGLLSEVMRDEPVAPPSREDRIRYWHYCLAVAVNRHAKPTMASAMFKKKFGVYPSDDMPNVPRRSQWHVDSAILFPEYLPGNRGKHAVSGG